jgi:universal stress protein E
VAAEQRVLVVVDPTASFHPAIERAAWLARSAPSILELFICDHASQLADARGALLARHKARLEQLA